MEKSYGLLVYRLNNQLNYEYLIVHPSGAYNKNAPFYLPKGGAEENESGQDAALRETLEETGIKGIIEKYLGTIEYKNKRKKISVWLAEYSSGEVDLQGHCLNHDWENDIAQFVPLTKVLELIREEFKPLIIEAHKYLTSKIIF